MSLYGVFRKISLAALSTARVEKRLLYVLQVMSQ